jgi:flagellar biosynthetic protein FliR
MISFTEAQLSAWYGSIFWPLVRVLALFATAPLLSHRAVPLRLKVGLALGIVIVLVPNLQAPPLADALTAPGLGLLLQNILVGLVIGFTVRLVFAALELAGELVGLQMGLSFAGFFNPASGQTQNAVANFLALLALLMFIAIDGHLMLVHALAESFRAFPLVADPAAGLSAALQFERIVRSGADMFSIALSIALPFLAVMLLVNLVLGVLARVAPQLNVFAVGFPLILLVGLTVLMLMLPYIEAPLRAAVERGITLWTR